MVYDLLVLALVLGASLLGAWKGLAWQMASVLSPVVGLGAGWPLSAWLAPRMGVPAPLDRWMALAILYVALSLAVHLLALAFRKGLERSRLDAWDHHVGFVAGALKGFLLAILLTAAVVASAPEAGEDVRSTRLGRVMGEVVAAIRPALPAGVREAVRPVLESLAPPGA
jgi:membrane protein required for colicin V production